MMDVESAVHPDEEGHVMNSPSRVVLPAIPPTLAEACCLLNCFAPGLGTFFASISCCCARTRGMTKSEIVASVFVGLFIALLQLMLTLLLFVGWIWSCFWGVLLTAQSDTYFKPPAEQRARTHRMLQHHQTYPDEPPPYTLHDEFHTRRQTPPPPYTANVSDPRAQPVTRQPQPQRNGAIIPTVSANVSASGSAPAPVVTVGATDGTPHRQNANSAQRSASMPEIV